MRKQRNRAQSSMVSIMPARKPAKAPKLSSEFDLEEFLESAGLARTIAKYSKGGVIFSQGDPATQVMYIQQGSVKLSVLSKTGKEAVVADARAAAISSAKAVSPGSRGGWRRRRR